MAAQAGSRVEPAETISEPAAPVAPAPVSGSQEPADCCDDPSTFPGGGCAGVTTFSVSIDQATLIASTTVQRTQQAPALVEAFSDGWRLLVEQPPLYLHRARPPDPPRSLHTLHSVFLI